MNVFIFVLIFVFVFVFVFVLIFVSAYLSLALGCKLPPAGEIEYLYMYLYSYLYWYLYLYWYWYLYLPTYLSLALGCKLPPACADFSQRELLSKTQLPSCLQLGADFSANISGVAKNCSSAAKMQSCQNFWLFPALALPRHALKMLFKSNQHLHPPSFSVSCFGLR